MDGHEKTDPAIQIVTKRRFGSHMDQRGSITEAEILFAINRETMYGNALVDIHTSDHLKSQVAQIPLFSRSNRLMDGIICESKL